MSETKRNDGGPAFPTIDGPPGEYLKGMTLRDWFAGQALVGIFAGLCADASSGDPSRANPRAFNRLAFDDAAKDSYYAADAMLAARAKDR